MRRATSEAAWSRTSKARPGLSQPRASGTRTRWPEEEIGMNSVRPWTAPSKSACKVDTGRDYKWPGSPCRNLLEEAEVSPHRRVSRRRFNHEEGAYCRFE